MQPLLALERHELESSLPGLDAELASHPLLVLEAKGSPAVAIFRSRGGPGMVVPEELGGVSRGPVHAVRLQRAIAARCPSLGVATTMHHFCVATLRESSVLGDMGRLLLQSIAEQRLLIASANAEGIPGRNILKPTVTAQRCENGYRLTGVKRPCSLAHSMDFLTATVTVVDDPPRRALVMVPGSAENLIRRSFWTSPVLAGAESDEVVLDGVFVPNEMLVFPETQAALDHTEVAAYIWFSLLVTAAYLGVASALVERALAANAGSADARVALVHKLETTASALEGAAHLLESKGVTDGVLARSLFVRFEALTQISQAAAAAAQMLGGMRFIRDPDISYLLSASHALAFHPPSQASATQPLAAYLTGSPLSLVD